VFSGEYQTRPSRRASEFPAGGSIRPPGAHIGLEAQQFSIMMEAKLADTMLAAELANITMKAELANIIMVTSSLI
jgi:hypothetical protein